MDWLEKEAEVIQEPQFLVNAAIILVVTVLLEMFLQPAVIERTNRMFGQKCDGPIDDAELKKGRLLARRLMLLAAVAMASRAFWGNPSP